VADNSVAKESTASPLGAIDELIRQDNVAGRDVLAQRTDCGHRQQPLDPQLLEAMNVGREVDLAWQEAMTSTVSRQKNQSHRPKLAHDVSI